MLRSSLLLGLFAFSAAANADDFSYNYVQIGYGEAEIDAGIGGDIDGDGPGIFGSLSLTESFHVFGEYQTADFGSGVDLNQLEAGLGYNVGLSESVDFVARLGYVNMEVDSPSGSADENGYSVGVGLRGQLAEKWEVNGALDYVDLDSDSETRAKAGFLYNFTDAIAFGASGTWWDDVTVYQLNARFNFGE